MRPEGDRPIWNLNFTGAQKLAYLDHRDTAFRHLNEIGKRIERPQRPRDDFFCRFGVVWKPNRCSDAGRCLLPSFLCEDCRAVTVLSASDAAREARYARANACDSLCHTLIVQTGTKNRRRLELEGVCLVASPTVPLTGRPKGASARERVSQTHYSWARAKPAGSV